MCKINTINIHFLDSCNYTCRHCFVNKENNQLSYDKMKIIFNLLLTSYSRCGKNENGFHMSFNDPLTGDLVSRVSCFRNGNTLFLNQLRYSLSIKYDEKDLI